MSETGDRKKRPRRENTDGPLKRPKRENTDSPVTNQFDDQSFIQRRNLRSGYLSIQSFIRSRKDEIASASTKTFIDLVDEVDGMHRQVTKPREQVSDAVALRDLANTLVTSLKVQNTGSTVTPSEFVLSLISKFGKSKRRGISKSTQIQWKEIGLHASPLFKPLQGCPTMLGRMKDNNTKVVTRKYRMSTLKEWKVKPKEVNETAEENTETELLVATMFDILKKFKKVQLENLILNRVSFAQTVENLFALSFLVKDGRVVITVDDEGFHHVSPRNAPSARMISSRKVEYSHFIFKFDFTDWKLMKELVGEGCELMPHRTPVDKEESVSPVMDEIPTDWEEKPTISDLDEKPTILDENSNVLNEKPSVPKVLKVYYRKKLLKVSKVYHRRNARKGHV